MPKRPKDKKILYLASNFRFAAQLLWNSNLEFDEVSAVKNTHQYLIWPRPRIENFSQAVVIGDNRSKISDQDWSLVCLDPIGEKKFFEVKLLGRLIKVIEYGTCKHLRSGI